MLLNVPYPLCDTLVMLFLLSCYRSKSFFVLLCSHYSPELRLPLFCVRICVLLPWFNYRNCTYYEIKFTKLSLVTHIIHNCFHEDYSKKCYDMKAISRPWIISRERETEPTASSLCGVSHSFPCDTSPDIFHYKRIVSCTYFLVIVWRS